jgi:hypothetical protein
MDRSLPSDQQLVLLSINNRSQHSHQSPDPEHPKAKALNYRREVGMLEFGYRDSIEVKCWYLSQNDRFLVGQSIVSERLDWIRNFR